MANVLCVLYDDPVGGSPPSYARDGIPNRYDRDANGDGVPDRYQGRYSSRY